MSLPLQYVSFGLVLSIPYTWLSGGGISCLIFGATLLPLALFLIEISRNIRYGVAILCLYVFSPIILNWVAILLQVIGMEWADSLSAWRYHPIWIVPFVYIFVDVTTAIFNDWRYGTE